MSENDQEKGVVDAENPFEMELSYNPANGTNDNKNQIAAAEEENVQDPAVQEKLKWRREILESELIYYADLNLLLTVRRCILKFYLFAKMLPEI